MNKIDLHFSHLYLEHGTETVKTTIIFIRVHLPCLLYSVFIKENPSSILEDDSSLYCTLHHYSTNSTDLSKIEAVTRRPE